MKKILFYILFFICLSHAREVKSFHPDSGTLIEGDDYYSLTYRDKEGNLFPLYSFNDGYASKVEASESYDADPDISFFSKTGKYFAIGRSVVICEEDAVKKVDGKLICEKIFHDKTYMDFIDMTTGCIVYYVDGSYTDGYMSKEKEGVWIVNSNPPFEINILRHLGDSGAFYDIANNNQFFLCNRDQVNNKPFYHKLLAQLKEFDSIENNEKALDLATEVNAYGLANIVSKNNVVFLNNLAFYLSGYYDQIDNGEFRSENMKYEKASRVLLEAILKKFPERTVAYLNLADGYYKFEGNLRLQKESKVLYRKYYDLMVKQNKEDKIPKRVYDRMGN